MVCGSLYRRIADAEDSVNDRLAEDVVSLEGRLDF